MLGKLESKIIFGSFWNLRCILGRSIEKIDLINQLKNRKWAMKIRGIMMGAVIVGALILLSYGLAFAAAATEAEAELPLIDCTQTIYKILAYDYGYVPPAIRQMFL